MVVGLGIDLVEIARIERVMGRHPRFAQKILTPEERAYCRTPAQIAGRWAAKEAIAKAVGLPMKWHEVEILPDAFGAPMVTIHSHQVDLKRLRIKVSITHERTHAAAVAIMERLVMQVPIVSG